MEGKNILTPREAEVLADAGKLTPIKTTGPGPAWIPAEVMTWGGHEVLDEADELCPNCERLEAEAQNWREKFDELAVRLKEIKEIN